MVKRIYSFFFLITLESVSKSICFSLFYDSNNATIFSKLFFYNNNNNNDNDFIIIIKIYFEE
jgi:hypothetical protein